MNEEMNNNVVNNNIPVNNNYESQKNNSNVLLIVLIVLVLCLIGLTCYKMFIYDKKDNNVVDNNGSEKKNTDEIKKNETEKVEAYEKINYEVKEEDELKYLYVNGKKIEETKTIESIDVVQFKDVLIVNVSQPGYMLNSGFVIDANGKLIRLKSPNVNYGDVLAITSGGHIRVDGNNIYFTYTRHNDGYIDWYCHLGNNLNEITSYEIKYKYLGNGKFSAGELTNEKSISEVYKEELKKCVS